MSITGDPISITRWFINPSRNAIDVAVGRMIHS
jgi:hypothetical protein